jgi:hypothetical protein
LRCLSCFAALAFVSGCATSQIREVKIPIPVPCITAVPTRPASAFDGVPIDAPVFDQVRGLTLDRERMGAYVGEMEAVLEACK